MKSVDKNILVIGLGRAGSRHYKNLLSLGYKNVFVYDANVKRVPAKAKSIKKLNKDNLDNFDIALICAPTRLHTKLALMCAKSGCHLFIEKPLSDNIKKLTQLEKICQQKNLINMVACNMRFHPCLSFIKKYLFSKKLGKIHSIYLEYGDYLLDWCSESEYQKSFLTEKKMGSIALDDIHEFDLLFWLNSFSSVKKSFFICNNSKTFKLPIKDNCLAMFEFENNVLGSVKCDYLQKKYSRNCKIVGSKGVIFWDFTKNEVRLSNRTKESVIFSKRNYNINDMYKNEIDYFIKSVFAKKKTENSIKESLVVLKHCLKTF